MGRDRLPDGVPPDNQKRGFDETSGFVAPDTATPTFRPLAAPVAPKEARAQISDDIPKDNSGFSRITIDIEEDDEDEDDDDDKKFVHGPHAPAPMLILIAIALVLAALAAYVVSQNSDPVNLCSQQPSWNQYNCTPG